MANQGLHQQRSMDTPGTLEDTLKCTTPPPPIKGIVPRRGTGARLHRHLAHLCRAARLSRTCRLEQLDRERPTSKDPASTRLPSRCLKKGWNGNPRYAETAIPGRTRAREGPARHPGLTYRRRLPVPASYPDEADAPTSFIRRYQGRSSYRSISLM